MFALSLILWYALQQPPAFRAEVRVVRVDAEVRQEARSIDVLTQQDFLITDGGQRQEILYFGRTEELLDLILLFDTSGSMAPAIERVSAVMRIALGELRRDDRVAVMAFDRDTDLIADFTSDRDAVASTIRGVVLKRPAVAFTRLQGAVLDAARHFLGQPRSNRRRAVLVVTDNMGSTRDEGAVEELWQADAVLSGVVVPGITAMRRQRMLFPATWFGFGTIDGIVSRTGGDTLKGDDPADSFRQMMQRLRLRYALHYAMPDAKPGKQRKIQVKLTPAAARRYSDARVYARSGYVVPE